MTSCTELRRSRAGGNGTAGTAMAVPDLRQKKWRPLDSNLRVRYSLIEWPLQAIHRSL